MSGLITLLVIASYLALGARYIMPFAKDCVRGNIDKYPSLYASKSERSALNREAVWVGAGKSLLWPYVLIFRWITSRLVDSLTAEERKAAELKDARRIIAEYEAEQFAKEGR